MKKYFIILAGLTAVLFQSCEKFLEEEFRSGAATDEFYGTNDGLEALVSAVYVTNRIWYGQEEGLDFTEIGTDLYSYGPEHPNPEMFLYNSDFDSQRGRLIVIYVEFYKGINAANEALYYLNLEGHPMDESQRHLRAAEMHFLRAFYYWHLVETFGEIAMPLVHTQEPITTAYKSSVDEVYFQIFKDLNQALAYFDEVGPTENSSDTDFGRITRDAVLAFRARLSLNAASYISSGELLFENGIPTDETGANVINDAASLYQQAADDAEAVIANSKYALYDDYSDLWLLANNTGNWNSEGIWAVNYSREITSTMNIDASEYTQYYLNGQKTWSDREGGDVRHLMFGMRYDVLPGMHRDMDNGRPFRRYFPLKSMVDLFDDNDSRWEEQFQLVYLANDDTTGLALADMTFPKWAEFDLSGISGFNIPEKNPEFSYKVDTNGDGTDETVTSRHVYMTGDTAVLLSRKDIPDDRIAPAYSWSSLSGLHLYVDCGCLVWDENLEYDMTSTSGPTPINELDSRSREYFYKLSKFDDNERLASNGTGSERGARDVYVFRLPEMYMIAAEANAIGGATTTRTATDYMTELADKRAKDGDGTALLAASIASSQNGTMDIYYFLDERAREFVGEQMRWYDLKRAFNRNDWVAYIQSKNNDAAANIQSYHYVRPIPQIQLDAITNSGNGEGEFGQNEGYN